MSPKLSIDHIPGSSARPSEVSWFQAPKSLVFVTVAPVECAALVVPLTALVMPVKLLPETPV